MLCCVVLCCVVLCCVWGGRGRGRGGEGRQALLVERAVSQQCLFSNCLASGSHCWALVWRRLFPSQQKSRMFSDWWQEPSRKTVTQLAGWPHNHSQAQKTDRLTDKDGAVQSTCPQRRGPWGMNSQQNKRLPPLQCADVGHGALFGQSLPCRVPKH